MSASPSDYRLVESRCPTCNYKLDGATIASGDDRKPESGDASVCLNCGQVLIYEGDLTLRKITAPEVSALMEVPDAWAVIEKAQMFIRRRGRFA